MYLAECVSDSKTHDNVNISLLMLTLMLGCRSNERVGAATGRFPPFVAGAAYGLGSIALDFALSAVIAC